MIIEKIATKKANFQRRTFFRKEARDGWKTIIEQFVTLNSTSVILLPAYIGWSPNEGSGIFDPIQELNVQFDFYRITSNLQIDIADLKDRIQSYKHVLVLLVHYFGFPDINYQIITNWFINNKIQFVEDCAHALLSDEIGGICGRKGAYAFYSLHKLFPFSAGGMVRINYLNNLSISADQNIHDIPFWEYDLYSIFRKRRENFNTLIPLLKCIPGTKLLFDELPEGVGPQTFPVFLEKDRDRIYHKMNEAGFGLVSLYHTLIKEIDPVRFDTSNIISKQIINFPVHQDCSSNNLTKMAEKFKEIYLT